MKLVGLVLRIRKISKDDLFGIFYVRKPDGIRYDSYYETINALRPLFKDKEFGTIVNGFYLNICGDFDSVRISYFVDEANSEKAISTFQHFFEESGISEIQNFNPPRKAIVVETYGNEKLEERFRYFLVLETQVGLELLKADLLKARILFATYCWQIRKAWLPVREHFEPTFLEYSPTYASLSKEEREQFLRDLERRPDWTHLMVNFVLGIDWRVSPGRPLSIPEINQILERDKLGFQIPPDWRP